MMIVIIRFRLTTSMAENSGWCRMLGEMLECPPHNETKMRLDAGESQNDR